jgi:hypothetical protein
MSTLQVHMFCDVVDVVSNPDTRAQFLQLPFAAVVALLRSNEVHARAWMRVLVYCMCEYALHIWRMSS